MNRCGTVDGLNDHNKAGETACPACNAAKAAYMREWRRRTGRTKQMLVPVPSGRGESR